MGVYNIEEELTILNPKEVSLYKDEFNRLRLDMRENGKNGGNGKDDDNKEHPAIMAVMGFPLTNPDHLISIIGMKDGKKDKEIGIIEDTKKLDSKSRKVLKKELKRAYFMPQITKINRLKEDHGMMKFDVDTDKGQREFETRYKEDIRKLGGGHVVIKDSDGNRYEIKDFRKLDQRSVILIDSEI